VGNAEIRSHGSLPAEQNDIRRVLQVYVKQLLCGGMSAASNDVQAFIQNFRYRYGKHHPAFHSGTFKQASI